MLNPKKIFLSKKQKYKIIEITNSTEEDAVLNDIAKCINNGIDVIELKNINSTIRNFLNIAQKTRELTSFFDVALIIHANVDIAKLVGADGITLDENTFTIKEVKKLAEETLLIGYAGKLIDTSDYIDFDFIVTKEKVNEIKILQFIY